MTVSTVERASRPGILTVGAVTASALAAVAVASVPTANATCASFFGIGSGGQCTSTLTSIAIAIGENAEAHADGILGAALSLGNASAAATAAGGLANLAVNLGNNNSVGAGGIASLAFAGRSTLNQTILAGLGGATSGNIGNIAVSMASPEATEMVVTGVGNLAVNIAGAGKIGGNGVGLTTVNLVGLNAELANAGVLNVIANISGDGIAISNDEGDGGIGNVGLNFIGENNVVRTRGTLALAGAIGSIGQTVEQDGPGVNVSFGRRAADSAAARAAAKAVAPASSSAGETAEATKSNRKVRGAQARANRSDR